MNNSNSVSKRLISLDVLRGFTIAGMILVNVPGSWEHIYRPFEHARFNGLTLADLVFPFFLFIVGASIFLALGKRIEKGISKKEIVGKIFYRSVIIFSIGVFLNWMTSDFSQWRIAGVLQRIALCYLFGSLMFVFIKTRWQILIGASILIGYWILTIYIPIPGLGKVFTREMNWTAWIDGKLLPGRMYFNTWDPEGILSTFSALVTTLTGMWAARLISATEDKIGKIKKLSVYVGILLIAGLILSLSFPLNKNVWSSSFVLVTAGLASLLWCLLIWLIDKKQKVSWTKPGVIFGANAITAYVLHDLLIYPFNRIPIGGCSVQTHFMNFFGSIIQPELASLIWAILYTSLCFLPIWWMYSRKIFIKI
jgi:predicted acyltransferase